MALIESRFGETASPATAQHKEPDIYNLLTVSDVARLLKVSKSWVYAHTRSRGTSRSERIPHIRIGKYVRFDEQAVRTFIARKTNTL